MKLTQETLLGFIQEEMDKTNELKSAQPKPGLFSILSKINDRIINEDIGFIKTEVLQGNSKASEMLFV